MSSPTNVSVEVGIDTPGSLLNVTVSDVTVTDSILGFHATDIIDVWIEATTELRLSDGLL